MDIKRTVTSLTAAATAVGLPAANAVAAATAPAAKKKVVKVSKTYTSPAEQADRWGEVQLAVAYTKTTTTSASGKKTVSVKITNVSAPVVPNHTDRSAYISEQAIPLLEQEVVQLQPSHELSTFQMVTGATDTSYAFAQSLQAALLAIGK